jgi:hypothetical protein
MTEKEKLVDCIELLKDDKYFAQYVDLLFDSLDEPQNEVAFTFALKGFWIYLKDHRPEEIVITIISNTIELMMQYLHETEQYEKLKVIKDLGLLL